MFLIKHNTDNTVSDTTSNTGILEAIFYPEDTVLEQSLYFYILLVETAFYEVKRVDQLNHIFNQFDYQMKILVHIGSIHFISCSSFEEQLVEKPQIKKYTVDRNEY